MADLRMFPVGDPYGVLPDPNRYSPMIEYFSPVALPASAGTHVGGRFLAYRGANNAVEGWLPPSASTYTRFGVVSASSTASSSSAFPSAASSSSAAASSSSAFPSVASSSSAAAAVDSCDKENSGDGVGQVARHNVDSSTGVLHSFSKEECFNVFANRTLIDRQEREPFFEWICDMTRFRDYFFVVVHPMYLCDEEIEEESHDETNEKADLMSKLTCLWRRQRAERRSRRTIRRECGTLRKPRPDALPCASYVVVYANDAAFVKTVASGSNEDLFVACGSFARWNDFIHRGLINARPGFPFLFDPPDVLKDLPLVPGSLPERHREEATRQKSQSTTHHDDKKTDMVSRNGQMANIRFALQLYDFQSRSVRWMKEMEDDESHAHTALHVRVHRNQWLQTMHTNIGYSFNQHQLIVGRRNTDYARVWRDDSHIRRQMLPSTVLAESIPTERSKHDWPSLARLNSVDVAPHPPTTMRARSISEQIGATTALSFASSSTASATSSAAFVTSAHEEAEAEERDTQWPATIPASQSFRSSQPARYSRSYDSEESDAGETNRFEDVDDDDYNDDFATTAPRTDPSQRNQRFHDPYTKSSVYSRGPLDQYRMRFERDVVELRGGFLCARTGTGKTISTLALFALQQRCNLRRVLTSAALTAEYSGIARYRQPPARVVGEMKAAGECVYYCAATLVVCPKQVCPQWAEQFVKASGCADAARVLVMSTFQDTKRVPLSDVLRHYDLIVLNKDIASNPNYRTIRAQWNEQIAQRLGWNDAKLSAVKSFLVAPHCYDVKIDYEQNPSAASSAAVRFLLQLNFEATRRAPDLVAPGSFFPYFNALLCKFARLVADEIHENDSSWRLVERFLSQILSDARWGLTATPAFANSTSFGAFADGGGYLALMRVPSKQRALLRRPCNRWQFVQHFTRRGGFSRMAPLHIERVDVQMSAQEMALYQSLDRVDLRTLVEFCCHHDITNDQWLRGFLPERVYRTHFGGGGATGDDAADDGGGGAHIAPHTVQEVAVAMQAARLKRIETLQKSTELMRLRWIEGEETFAASMESCGVLKRIVDAYRRTMWWRDMLTSSEESVFTTTGNGAAAFSSSSSSLSSSTSSSAAATAAAAAAASSVSTNSETLQRGRKRVRDVEEYDEAFATGRDKGSVELDAMQQDEGIVHERATETTEKATIPETADVKDAAVRESGGDEHAAAAEAAAAAEGAVDVEAMHVKNRVAAFRNAMQNIEYRINAEEARRQKRARIAAFSSAASAAFSSATATDEQNNGESQLQQFKKTLEEAFQQQTHDRRQYEADLETIRSVKRQHAYYSSVFAMLDNADAPIECPVCLRDIPRTETVLTTCGHQFCMECIEMDNHDRVRAERKRLQADAARGRAMQNALSVRCAMCRTSLHVWNDIKIIDRTATTASREKEENEKKRQHEQKQQQQQQEQKRKGQTSAEELKAKEDYARFGSKIQTVVARIGAITALPDAKKIIVFAQSHHLLHLIGDALRAFRVSFVYVEGRDSQRNIDRFRHDSSVRVILLSSELRNARSSISGLDLIEANYVIAVHPPFGTDDECFAIMQQAIGRVQRQGQESDCHLLVMVTRSTIEESLYEQWRERHDREARIANGALEGERSERGGGRDEERVAHARTTASLLEASLVQTNV